MNRTQLRGLSKLPYFDKDAIRECLQMGSNYIEKDYEQELKDDSRNDEYGASQFEVLEYWGVMDAEYARQVGMEIDEGVDDLDEIKLTHGFAMVRCFGQWLTHSRPLEYLITLLPMSVIPIAFLELA